MLKPSEFNEIPFYESANRNGNIKYDRQFDNLDLKIIKLTGIRLNSNIEWY